MVWFSVCWWCCCCWWCVDAVLVVCVCCDLVIAALLLCVSGVRVGKWGRLSGRGRVKLQRAEGDTQQRAGQGGLARCCVVRGREIEHEGLLCISVALAACIPHTYHVSHTPAHSSRMYSMLLTPFSHTLSHTHTCVLTLFCSLLKRFSHPCHTKYNSMTLSQSVWVLLTWTVTHWDTCQLSR